MNKIVFLVKDPNRPEYEKYAKFFTDHIEDCETHFIKLVFNPEAKKSSIGYMKEQIQNVFIDQLVAIDPDALIICDAGYFKAFTGLAKAEPYLGYVCPTKAFKTNKIFNAFYTPTAEQIFYNPSTVWHKINLALSAALAKINSSYVAPGSNIIKFEEYPDTVEEIKSWLKKLHDYPALTCDIETKDLKFYKTRISTITFCWSEHEGIAFRVEHERDFVSRMIIESALKDFFINYKGKLIFHNIAFDATHIIATLGNITSFDMDPGEKNAAVCAGLKYVLKNFEDTKLISYLALNSCTRQSYGLKDLAQEFSGNYAQEDIDNIDKIPTKDLLRYNLIDGLSTWYVYNKNYPKMIAENQKDIYENIFKPATIDIVHMQLSGMPLNIETVEKTSKLIDDNINIILTKFNSFVLVQTFNNELAHKWADAKNAILKKKKVTYKEAPGFNINSNAQLQSFLYDFLELPIIEHTDSNQPTTGADVLDKLKNHTNNESIKEILQLLIDYKAAYKIKTAFIPTFKDAFIMSEGDDTAWLHGNFNLGGTVSGRLSSSGPNLQQIPATGSKYAKAIKKCFQAPKGWLLVGLDFSSLEDRISALTTKDPNKLGVYIHSYDGHCLRAYSYFQDKMPDITERLKGLEPDSKEYVKVINSIKNTHKDLRQLSKSPTFALTYAGSWSTLVKNCGFDEDTAKNIEKAYHDLYKVSDLWVKNKLDEATKTGYVLGAFGLKIRTPILHQTLFDKRVTPREAMAEGRTAGNALGQSYCMLTSRAGIEFNKKVRDEGMQQNIIPISQIHDAQYFLVRNNLHTVLWVNKYLVKAVQWQEDPAIAHDKVKLSGELSIFFPSWAEEYVIPNDCNEEQLLNICKGDKNGSN